MANQTMESRSELDTIRDEQFKILVEAISQLQSLGISDEIQDEAKEDIQFDVTQAKLKLQREKIAEALWVYRVQENTEIHGPFSSFQLDKWQQMGYFND